MLYLCDEGSEEMKAAIRALPQAALPDALIASLQMCQYITAEAVREAIGVTDVVRAALTREVLSSIDHEGVVWAARRGLVEPNLCEAAFLGLLLTKPQSTAIAEIIQRAPLEPGLLTSAGERLARSDGPTNKAALKVLLLHGADADALLWAATRTENVLAVEAVIEAGRPSREMIERARESLGASAPGSLKRIGAAQSARDRFLGSLGDG